MIRQFLSGTKAVLLNQPIVNGQILFPNDASEIYYDMNGTRRGVTGVSYVRYDSDLTGIVNPEEKLYFSLDSRRMFAYDASTHEFIQVNRTGVVTNLTSAQRTSLESCAEDCIYIDSDTMEAYVGVNLGSNSASSSLFGSVFWRRIGESISNYNGQVNVRTNDKNVISTDQDGNISIGSNSTGVNVLTSNLKLNGNNTNTAGGLLVLDGNGMVPSDLISTSDEVIKQDILFGSSDLTENKLVISDCYVGDFAITDNNGHRVMPDEIQSGSNVIVDFTNFNVTGTWKVHFTSIPTERDSVTVTLSELTNNKYTIENCTVGDFSVVDNDGNRILPDEQQVGSNVVLDFTGFPDETVKIIYGPANDSLLQGYQVIELNNTSIRPKNLMVYSYTLSGNEEFQFTAPTNRVVNFRLYLTMPSTLVSFTLPTNIVWEGVQDFTATNALYMLVFEWNPVLNKWLGNQMWEPVLLGE